MRAVLILCAAALALAQAPKPGVIVGGSGGGGGGGGTNASASSVAAVTSLVVDVSALNAASTNQFIFQCRQTVSPFSVIPATMNPASLTSVTLNFASTANIVCTVNATGTGPAGAAGATGATGPAGANGAISLIQDEGSGLTVRPTINFTGAGVTATDDAGNNRTNVSITATGGGLTIQNDGTPLPAQPILNVIGGNGISTACVDDAGNTRTNCTNSINDTITATRTRVTQGDDQSCIPTSGSGTAYTCVPASGTAYPGYTNGARLMFRPDAACGATPTLNVSSLGARRLYASDGTSDPSCASGLSYWLVYNTSLNAGAGGWVFPPAGGGALVTEQRLPLLQCNGTIISGFQWNPGNPEAFTATCGQAPFQGADVVTSDTRFATVNIRIPANWTGAAPTLVMNIAYNWGPISTTYIMRAALACPTNTGTITYNTATNSNTVTLGPAAGAIHTMTFTGLDTTGCTAGGSAILRLNRNASGSGTHPTGTGDLQPMIFDPVMRWTVQ